jgi:hypothetical protein
MTVTMRADVAGERACLVPVGRFGLAHSATVARAMEDAEQPWTGANPLTSTLPKWRGSTARAPCSGATPRSSRGARPTRARAARPRSGSRPPECALSSSADRCHGGAQPPQEHAGPNRGDRCAAARHDQPLWTSRGASSVAAVRKSNDGAARSARVRASIAPPVSSGGWRDRGSAARETALSSSMSR